jgi:calcineurin-like phosphoesterase family protein
VRRRALILVLALAVLCSAGAAPASATTVWAVGDGASPADEDNQLADFLQRQPLDRFLYLGDVYETGTAAEYASYYETSFGRFKAITSPTPGNHEWDNRAQGYDPYWGPSVAQPNGGHYYSFDLAGWHFVSLNSEEPADSASAQASWLRNDLARYRGTCTIAMVHRPRFSTGPQYNTTTIAGLWGALRGHAVALLSGHAHNYQRLFPVQGITQFVVGTGGWELSSPDRGDPRLAAGAGQVVGAIRLDLLLGQVNYQFITTDSERLDAGSIQCVPHGPAPARIRVTAPKNGGKYRVVHTIRGRASNARRLSVNLVRRNGRRCSVYDGFRFRRSACSSRRAVNLLRTDLWSLRPRGGLPRGAYRATVKARALDLTAATRTVRFTVGSRRR